MTPRACRRFVRPSVGRSWNQEAGVRKINARIRAQMMSYCQEPRAEVQNTEREAKSLTFLQTLRPVLTPSGVSVWGRECPCNSVLSAMASPKIIANAEVSILNQLSIPHVDNAIRNGSRFGIMRDHQN